jgi:hypothetical protein
LFHETDYTEKPLHIQFIYTILREAMISDEECVIAPEVRTKISILKNA